MSDHLLNLPFAYSAQVLPRPRQRIPCEVTIREYTSVLIPELGRDDLEVAIEYDDYERLYDDSEVLVGPIYSWNDRLYRAATTRDGARVLGVQEFGDAVSARWAHFLKSPNKAFSPFHPSKFPTRGNRWGYERNSPLGHDCLEEIVRERGWDDRRRIVASTREMEMGWAQANLSHAVISVDGEIHVECPEPVWAVDAYGRNANGCVRVRLEPTPCQALTFNHFRLDLLDEARDWAKRLHGDGAAPANVRFLADNAIQRDDEWLLACHIVTRCGFLRGPLDQSDDDPRERVGALAASFRRDDRIPSPPEAEDLLEALEISIEAMQGEGLTGHTRTDSVLQTIMERWRLARSAGRGQATRPLLDAIDMDAISDLLDGRWP